MAHAARADEPRARALFAMLSPRSGRLEMALRLALICTLTALIALYYGTPEPALTVYIVFFMNHPDRTTSVIFSVAFTLIITLTIAIIFGLAILVVDAPAWRVATMAILSITFLFLGSASKLRPIAPIIALIVAYALDLLGNIPFGELATRGLLYAWLFVGIPAGVSIVVNLIAGPAPRRMLEKSIADRLRLSALFLSDQSTPAERARFHEAEDEGASILLARLHLAHVERAIDAAQGEALAAAANSTAAIMSLSSAIAAEPTVPKMWREASASRLSEMAQAFDRHGYPIGIEPIGAVDGSTTGKVGAALAMEFDRLLVGFTTTVPADVTPAANKPGGFFLPDAFSNPAHLDYALKTTAAAMFCYVLFVLLDWPGIHTCLITCYIVSLGTVGETVEKLGLRILGCMIGAAAGLAAIIWVVPALETIRGILAVIFVGALAAGWVAAGSPRIAYAGFQMAFAFFLCVIQGSGPQYDLTIARDRTIGILLGIAVTYVIFTHIRPVSISRSIDPSFATLMRLMSAAARAPRESRTIKANAARAQMATLRNDFALTRYEPASVRLSDEWTETRRQMLGAAREIQRMMLLDNGVRFWARIADRLDILAEKLEGKVAASDVDGAVFQTLRPDGPSQQRASERLAFMEHSLAR